MFVIIFLKILFLTYKFSPHVPVDIIRVFLFQNLQQKISKPIKPGKKITHFTIQFRSKNLVHFTNRNSFEIEIICSQNTTKKRSHYTDFPANMFLFSIRKNICTSPFPDTQELLSWSTLKANIWIFLYISLRKFLF